MNTSLIRFRPPSPCDKPLLESDNARKQRAEMLPTRRLRLHA